VRDEDARRSGDVHRGVDLPRDERRNTCARAADLYERRFREIEVRGLKARPCGGVTGVTGRVDADGLARETRHVGDGLLRHEQVVGRLDVVRHHLHPAAGGHGEPSHRPERPDVDVGAAGNERA